jgi:capsular polysaccharide transport system permease protein
MRNAMSNTTKTSEMTEWRYPASASAVAGAPALTPLAVMQEPRLTPLSPAVDSVVGSAAPARRLSPFFYALVPAFFAAIYLFVFAADVFESEARFMVRTASASTFSALVQSHGMTSAPDDAYAIVAFAQSRDLVDKLANEDNLRQIYARPEADVLSKYPRWLQPDTLDHLLQRFKDWTDIRIEETSGIVTLRAYAYRSDDARALAEAILRRAEAFVNEMNSRALSDRVNSAGTIRDQANARVADVEARLTMFRNENRFVDPARESAASLDAIGKLSTEVAQLEAMLKQKVQLTPQNPTIPALRGRIANYREQIEKMRRQVVGASDSMSTKLAAYEHLVLERRLAARELEVAHMNFQAAQQDSQQQQVYLERIANPTAPDRPDFPRRGLWLAISLFASIGVFIIASSLIGIAREHN